MRGNTRNNRVSLVVQLGDVEHVAGRHLARTTATAMSWSGHSRGSRESMLRAPMTSLLTSLRLAAGSAARRCAGPKPRAGNGSFLINCP
jgi:hypothetical protein